MQSVVTTVSSSHCSDKSPFNLGMCNHCVFLCVEKTAMNTCNCMRKYCFQFPKEPQIQSNDCCSLSDPLVGPFLNFLLLIYPYMIDHFRLIR